MAEDGTISGLVGFGGLRGGGSQGSNSLIAAARNELGVSKTLVVTRVAKEHSSILKEGGKLGFINTSFFAKRVPITGARLMERNNQVIYGLGLGRKLSQNNSGSSKRSPRHYEISIVLVILPAYLESGKRARDRQHNLLANKVGISLLLITQRLEVLLNLEADDRWRLVRQIVLKLLGFHIGV